MSIKDDKNSWNVAFLGDIKNPKYIAFVYNYSDDDEKKYQIIFNKKEIWNNCLKDRNTDGYNFLKTSQHELGHFFGRKDSNNKKEIMYPVGKRCKDERFNL